MMTTISNVHDNFVRELLADKQVAMDYFKSALPEQIVQKLDLSAIEQLSGSYVSGELEKTISDVVYRCRRKDCQNTVHISLLVEHKSSPDKYTPIQVGGYLFSGYQQQIKQGHKRLSPIIPILFYHGKKKWEYWTLDRLFADLDSDLLGFIPGFDYIYNNLRDTPDEVIKAIGNRFLAASLLTLKHSFDKQWLEGNFTGMLGIALPHGSGSLQKAFLMYYLHRVNFTGEEVKKVIKEIPYTIQEEIMSTYELLVQEGEEKKSYGVVKNLILDFGFSDEQAAKAAEVSIDFVKKVRSALRNKK